MSEAGDKKTAAARKIFPVLCASSANGIGVVRVLDACVALLPSPESSTVEGAGKDGHTVRVFTNEKDHAVAQVFKTRIDPFVHEASMHTGMDFRGTVGDPIHATAAGKVVKAA